MVGFCCSFSWVIGAEKLTMQKAQVELQQHSVFPSPKN